MSGQPISAARVAVVGGAGFIGVRVVDALVAAGEDVVVIDRAVPRRAVPCAQIDLGADDAGPRLARVFQTHEVTRVIHLVAQVNPPKDDAERARMRALHEGGTAAVVDAALAADVDAFVLVSSAVVYGAHADNAVPLPTSSPLRPNAFPYAEDKAAQERVCRERFGDDGRLRVVRPAIVYGPGAKNYLTEIIRRARLPLLRRGVLPALDGHRPLLQFVHVDDVAAVVTAATLVDDDGPHVYHAAPDDWLAYDDVARAAGLRVVDVNAELVGAVVERLLPLMPPSLRAPRALFPYLMFPFVLDRASTTRALGVSPRFTSADALAAMLHG